MTQTANRPATKGVLETLPEELDDFERQVKKFQAGEWDEIEFQAFRLKQGVYGQRQADVQMVRVKAPFGGVTAEMLDALGESAAKFAPPHQAGGHAEDDARAGRGRHEHARGVREHGAQRYGLPQSGSVRRRSVQRDALRGRIRALLREASGHAGDAAKGEIGILGLRG